MSHTTVDELVVIGARNDALNMGDLSYYQSDWDRGGSGEGTIAQGPVTTTRETVVNRIRQHLDGDDPKFTQQDLQDMRIYDIKLNEVLAPGIYQQEFQVVFGGLVTSPAEHRQWIKVNPSGNSEIITAVPGTTGKIDVIITSWETADHGRNSPAAELRTYALTASINNLQDTNARWSLMLSKAQELEAKESWMNYNGLEQNSNSVFFTVGLAGKITANDTGLAPGFGVNLDGVTSSNQPGSLGPGSSAQQNGTEAGETIAGGSGSTEIFGHGGDDDLRGGSNYDIIFGGDGADRITLFGGAAKGGPGNDVMSVSGVAAAQMSGDGGDDSLTGNAGADAINGGLGNDTAHGRAGDDVLNMDAGNDTAYGGQGDDMFNGGWGDDVLYGDLGNDAIYGEGGADNMFGLDGNDVLIGGGGNDTLSGGVGDDFLRGGKGADRLNGGAGIDTFAYGLPFTPWQYEVDSGYFRYAPNGPWYVEIDVIEDFTSGTDKIDLRDIGGIGYSNLTIVSGGGSTTVSWDTDGDGQYPGLWIQLPNTPSLQASDFIFA